MWGGCGGALRDTVNPNLSCLLSIYTTVGLHLLLSIFLSFPLLTHLSLWHCGIVGAKRRGIFTVYRMMQVFNETGRQKWSVSGAVLQFGRLMFIYFSLSPSQAFICSAP